MFKKVTIQTRRELVEALRLRYGASSREDKTRILHEFSATTGCHRKSAIRILNGTGGLVDESIQHTRRHLYDGAVREALVVLWEAADRICGKRLKAILPVLASALERHQHLQVEPAVRTKLMAMSAATMDRLLRDVRAHSSTGRRRRVPTALRRRVPIRTFDDWNDPPPGYMEMDLVAHCGGSAVGSYVHTLSATDLSSGWTECIPLVVRAGSLVIESLETLQANLPFSLRGLDVDNGGEFLNEAMVRYCATRGIELTRSRPYHSNDQAWIEQKNGSVVRRLVGYDRHEGAAATEILSRLYASARLFVNFFQPSFKLREKARVGARIIKRYHAPETPCRRLLMSNVVSDQVKSKLAGIAESLDPLQLLDEIRSMQSHLAVLSGGGKPSIAVPRKDNLTQFLSGLSVAWHDGEVRSTHRRLQRPPRRWRTRIDPFITSWSIVQEWLHLEPAQNGKDLFRRLQRQYPGIYPDCQLRTLQRRLKEWRSQRAHELVFGANHVMTDRVEILEPRASAAAAADCPTG